MPNISSPDSAKDYTESSPPVIRISRDRMRLGIFLQTILAAVVYGIIHDQITARICIEYFTVFHPNFIGTDSPTLQGLFWGVFATIWMGAGLGTILGIASTVGPKPMLSAKDIRIPTIFTTCAMALLAMFAGFIGYVGTINGVFAMPGYLTREIPISKAPYFMADLFAHNASYFVGGVGGIFLAVCIWKERGREMGRDYFRPRT